MPEPKTKSRGRVLWALAIVLAISALPLKQLLYDRIAESGPNKAFNSIRDEAAKHHPNKSHSEAMQLEATKRANERLDSKPGKSAKASSAANMFWGALLVNTRARVKYCRDLGVDISAFKDAVERLHQREIAKAAAIYAREGADIERVWNISKLKAGEAVDIQMKDLAKANNWGLIGSCKLFAEEAEGLAREMHISKVNPGVFHALMAD